MPGINIRSKRFRDLRLYALDVHKYLKSKFLIGLLLGFFKNLVADYLVIFEYNLIGNA